MVPLDRRTFLRRLAGAAGGTLAPGALVGLVAACTSAGSGELRGLPVERARIGEGGYGPLEPTGGPLRLPPGFRASTVSAVGDPMSGGRPTPIAPDGMAAFPGSASGAVRLVRNHEDRNGPADPIGVRPYDPVAGGGCVSLEVDGDGRLVRDGVSLSGTAVNCAGGPTPWGSWLTCEETVAGRSEGFRETHGWVFEVPADRDEPVDPVPLTAMGRFRHEAVAVDPETGIVYQTEDHLHPPGSGFYRFLPDVPGELAAGGRLEMARIPGEPRAELFRGSAVGIRVGDSFAVDWVPVEVADPDPDDDLSEGERSAAVFLQGHERGAAVFARLEGCWYGPEGVHFHDTVGGAAGEGHVWRYEPERLSDEPHPTLTLVFESPGSDVLARPDNITVSPRGGLVLCEDAAGVPRLRGLTPDGRIFDLAANDLNESEFAGATFSPDGATLFVNIQGPTRGTPETAAGEGRTLAIRGPWERGAL